jgi:hypothetical protein
VEHSKKVFSVAFVRTTNLRKFCGHANSRSIFQRRRYRRRRHPSWVVFFRFMRCGAISPISCRRSSLSRHCRLLDLGRAWDDHLDERVGSQLHLVRSSALRRRWHRGDHAGLPNSPHSGLDPLLKSAMAGLVRRGYRSGSSTQGAPCLNP